jgi:hypothetical protein
VSAAQIAFDMDIQAGSVKALHWGT